MRRIAAPLVALVALAGVAQAQQRPYNPARVHDHNDITLPLGVSDCLYVDHAGVDQKLCNPDSSSFPALTAIANSWYGNLFGDTTSVLSSTNTIANTWPPCADTSGQHLTITLGTRLSTPNPGSINCTSGATQPDGEYGSPLLTFATASLTTVIFGVTGSSPTGTQQTILNPIGSTNYIISANGWATTNTVSDGGTVQLVVGTGTPPVNGATVPVGATLIGAAKTFRNPTGATRRPFALMAYATGLTGCPCWVDIAGKVAAGGTWTLQAVNVTANER